MHEKILVADDENAVRESVATALRREGFTVEAVSDGKAAWNAANTGGFALAVLDISMPLLEGTAVLARIRAAKLSLPVIFLTSRDEELDRIAGLESGADDYISKPFSIGELTARIKAVLRRSSVPVPVGLAGKAGAGLTVRPECLSVYWDETEIKLTLTEFRMLDRLHHRPGEVVSREALMQFAFPLDNYASDRSADSHIKRLRKKLEAAGAPDTCIETMYGAGYRLRPEAG